VTPVTPGAQPVTPGAQPTPGPPVGPVTQGGPPLVGATAAVVLVVLSAALLLAFVRIARGPSLPDRVVALDLSGTLVVGIIAAYGILAGQPVFLDVAIALALVAFLGTVAFARYLERANGR
jgi:multicomponent Na+:H+ antiporter subunit F